MNAKLRTQKEVMLEKKIGLANILLALRSEIDKDGNSGLETDKSQKPNTLKAAKI